MAALGAADLQTAVSHKFVDGQLLGYGRQMEFKFNGLMDWNPVIHIMDELSDGTHSFLELSYMIPNYDRANFCEALLFLADRNLIELSVERGPYGPIHIAEWPGLFMAAFERETPADPTVMTRTGIDLTEAGEQILSLFKIGNS